MGVYIDEGTYECMAALVLSTWMNIYYVDKCPSSRQIYVYVYTHTLAWIFDNLKMSMVSIGICSTKDVYAR